MIALQTKGFDLLTPKTKEEFQKLWENHSAKIERKLKNTESCKIHIKEYSPGGKTKFSIHVMIKYAGKALEADSVDWDLKKAFHRVFKKIEQEAEHMFHISDQHQKRKRAVSPFD